MVRSELRDSKVTTTKIKRARKTKTGLYTVSPVDLLIGYFLVAVATL